MPLVEDLLAFVDTETSGLVPGVARVIEVATILATLGGTELARFDARIQVPDEHAVPLEVAGINGFDRDEWRRTAVPFAEYEAFLKRWVQRGHVAVPVGHNVGFDRRMIHESHYGARFCPLSYHLIDTVSLAGVLRQAGVISTPNLKLGTVCDALGVVRVKDHRAMSDCLAAREIYLRCADLLREGHAFAVTSHG